MTFKKDLICNNITDDTENTNCSQYCHIEAVGDEKHESIVDLILSLIKKISYGFDLSQISLPTELLEPRSLLQRILDYMIRPFYGLHFNIYDNPEDRFVNVVKYFLSAWVDGYRYIKKPYNPIVGEVFKCTWKYKCPMCNKESDILYIAEQVSHYPPITIYIYANKQHGLVIEGMFMPSGQFRGNTTILKMRGKSIIYNIKRPDEIYYTTNPNIYIKGIMIGKMHIEQGDISYVKCPKTGYSAEIEFKLSNFFSNNMDSIVGYIKNRKQNILYTITGKWSSIMKIIKSDGNEPIILIPGNEETIKGKKIYFFKDSMFECLHIWNQVTDSLKSRDHQKANKAKQNIEDLQRKWIDKLKKLHVKDSKYIYINSTIDDKYTNNNRSGDKGQLYIDTNNSSPKISRYFTLVNDEWRFNYTGDIFENLYKSITSTSDPLIKLYNSDSSAYFL